jgi:quercetin dioxygenase-like cupin family protein
MVSIVSRKRFAVPVDLETVAADWKGRGFSCDLFVDPPGRAWVGFTHPINEVVCVAEGRLELTVGETTVIAQPGDEVFIPAGTVHSVRNRHNSTSRWFYGYD